MPELATSQPHLHTRHIRRNISWELMSTCTKLRGNLALISCSRVTHCRWILVAVKVLGKQASEIQWQTSLVS